VVSTFFSGYYKGRDYLKINKSIKPDFIYDDISQLFSHLKAKSMKFDVIINDIGRPVNSEAIIDMANETAIQFLNDGGYLYTKTFANPHHLWSMKCWSDITLPYESKTCTERIFRCVYQQGRDINDFYKYYDRPGWNRRITVHVIPTQDHYTFSNLFFNGKLGDLDLASLRPRILTTIQREQLSKLIVFQVLLVRAKQHMPLNTTGTQFSSLHL